MAEIIEYPSTHRALRQFRDAALETTKHAGDVEPLTRIVAVGVPFTPVFGFHCREDVRFVQFVFKNLKAAKIPVSPDFIFVPMDMRRGQDFLNPRNDTKPDVLVFAMIAGTDHPERESDRYASGMGRVATLSFSLKPPFISCDGIAPYFRLSPFDKGPESWDEATARANPKVIISNTQSDKDICAKPSALYTGDDMPNISAYADMEARMLVRKDFAGYLKKAAELHL